MAQRPVELRELDETEVLQPGLGEDGNTQSRHQSNATSSSGSETPSDPDIHTADAGSDGRPLAAAAAAADGNTDGTGTRRRFDPNTAADARYLGDMDEVGGSGELLEEGVTYTLPLFALEGVVLLPGASLPLILHSIPDILKLERSLRAPADSPTARLIAVAHVHRRHMATCLVCCSAEVRRVRRDAQLQEGGDLMLQPRQHLQQHQQQNHHQQAPGGVTGAGTGAGGRGLRGAAGGVVAVVARGRQRLLLDPVSLVDTYRVRCRVLPEGLAEPPPRQISAGAGFWAPWAARTFDAPALAALAQRLCSGVLPQIACKADLSRARSSPLAVQQFSYWLAINLPLTDEQRQLLLECRDAAERLRLLLGWLSRLGTVACKECGSPVTQCNSALLMSSEGPGGAFVNAHGYVHDIATFRSAQGLACVGLPETAHSWFPGYAWTIAVCATCGEHMGWRFTAASTDLYPIMFWGIRRSAITCPDLQGRRGGGGDAAGATGGRGRGPAGGLAGGTSSEEEYELVYEEDTYPESEEESDSVSDSESESEEGEGEDEEGGAQAPD